MRGTDVRGNRRDRGHSKPAAAEGTHVLSWTHGARHPLLLEGFGNVSAARSQSFEELRSRPRDFHGLRAHSQLQALQELTKR